MKERTQSTNCTDNHRFPSAAAAGVSSDFVVDNKLVLLKLSKSDVACDKKINPITKVIGTNLVKLSVHSTNLIFNIITTNRNRIDTAPT